MNVFNLFAKLSMDTKEYDDKMDKSSEKAHSFGSALKSGLGAAAKAVGVAVTAAAAGVSVLTKNAIANYSQYEQLVGGIDTLFKRPEMSIQEYAASTGHYVEEVAGEYANMSAAADAMMKQASVAYKTAGLSANEYMETAIQSSAAMISALGGDTQKAAELVDMSIIDMADNVNKMGTTMEAVQNAYRGFSRGNFTMLDNLALGFAGTKEGMQELLDKAQEISGIEYDISSYADIVEAIHVVQTEMGITGTTAREAASTIEGSTKSMKAAWQNLVTGIADDNADFGTLVDDFASSVLTVGDNLLPRIGKVLEGVGQLVKGLAPIITKALPPLISDILPTLLNSALELITAVAGTLLDNLPLLLDTAFQIILTLATALSEHASEIVPYVMMLLQYIVDTLTEPTNLETLLDAAFTIIFELAIGLIEAIPQLVSIAFQIIEALVTYLVNNKEMLFDGAVRLFSAIISAVGQVFSMIFGVIGGWLASIWESISTWFEESVIQPIGEFFDEIWQSIEDFFAPIIDFFSPILEALQYLFETVWAAIKIVVSDAVENAWEKITTVWEDIKNWVNDTILEPLKEAFETAWSYIYDKIEEPLNKAWDFITGIFDDIKEYINGIIEEATSWGKDLIDNLVGGIREKIESVGEAITGVANKIRERIGFSEPEIGPLSNFHTFAPDMMRLFAQGIKDNEDLITSQLEKSFDFRDVVVPQNGANAAQEQMNEQPIEIPLILDGAVLARATYRYNKSEQQRHGTTLVYA